MKIILFIVFFAVFFEAGLISSYTIVTSQPPDVGKLSECKLMKLRHFELSDQDSIFSIPNLTRKLIMLMK